MPPPKRETCTGPPNWWGRSPAAISKAIKSLEADIGVPLTVASGRGIALTDAGLKLARKAGRVLEEFDQLKRHLLDAEQERVLKVGSFEVFTTHLLGCWLPEASEGVVLHELAPGKLEEALVNGDVDVGLTYLPVPHPELDFLKVATLEMGVFCRKGPLLERPWNALPFVVPASPIHGVPTRIVGLDGWPDSREPRRVGFRVTLMESALKLCREGRAAAFLPVAVVREHNRDLEETLRLQHHPGPLPLRPEERRQPVYLVKRKGWEENAATKKMAKALRLTLGTEKTDAPAGNARKERRTGNGVAFAPPGVRQN